MLLFLYVDDVIIAATSKELALRYVKIIGRRFCISYSSELRGYLNIGIEHDRLGKTVYLSQEKYIEQMITDLEIPNDAAIWTPMQKNFKLLAAEEEIAIASNPAFHQRTQHISIKFQYANENVENGNMVLQFLKSKDNFGNMFTKPVGPNIYLSYNGFEDHRPGPPTMSPVLFRTA